MNHTRLLLLTLVGVSFASSADAYAEMVACTDTPAVRPEGEFANASRAISRYRGEPKHVAFDTIVPAGATVVVAGKFAYGSLSHDVEGEVVDLYVLRAHCANWQKYSNATTDRDGRASIEIPRDALTVNPSGVSPVRFALVLRANGAIALGTAWITPPATRTVVFDVDGTLTTGDDEILQEVLAGRIPEVRPDAQATVARRAREGAFVVYVTGRPYPLLQSTKDWLAANRFTPGPIIVAPSSSAVIPDRAHVGAYKRGELQRLTRNGLVITAAYGNAQTDICAYAEAGIPAAQTFIIGATPGSACDSRPAPTHIPSYTAHLAQMGQSAPETLPVPTRSRARIR